MAKKKKAVKRSTRRKGRKVGALKDLDLTKIALVVGGAVGANVLSQFLEKSDNSTLQKAAPFGALVAGVVLPMFVKGKTVSDLSLGLLAVGGVNAINILNKSGVGFLNNAIAYPGGYTGLPYSQVAGLTTQGEDRGTYSNFSGSRQSQINTIAGVSGIGCDGSMGI